MYLLKEIKHELEGLFIYFEDNPKLGLYMYILAI